MRPAGRGAGRRGLRLPDRAGGVGGHEVEVPLAAVAGQVPEVEAAVVRPVLGDGDPVVGGGGQIDPGGDGEAVRGVEHRPGGLRVLVGAVERERPGGAALRIGAAGVPGRAAAQREVVEA